jgi:hypothetical protein
VEGVGGGVGGGGEGGREIPAFAGMTLLESFAGMTPVQARGRLCAGMTPVQARGRLCAGMTPVQARGGLCAGMTPVQARGGLFGFLGGRGGCCAERESRGQGERGGSCIPSALPANAEEAERKAGQSK